MLQIRWIESKINLESTKKLMTQLKEKNKKSSNGLIDVWLKFMPENPPKQTKLSKISKRLRLQENKLRKTQVLQRNKTFQMLSTNMLKLLLPSEN